MFRAGGGRAEPKQREDQDRTGQDKLSSFRDSIARPCLPRPLVHDIPTDPTRTKKAQLIWVGLRVRFDDVVTFGHADCIWHVKRLCLCFGTTAESNDNSG